MSFHPTNPFLAMLAAVGDESEGSSQQEGVVAAGTRTGFSHSKLRLPEFWSHAPAMWFARAETSFRLHGIEDEYVRYAHVSDALPYEAMRLVADIIERPPSSRPFSILKERLLVANQLSPVQRAAKVMAMPELGDRRPSAMLAAMLEFCPPGEDSSAFFRACFLNRLPMEIQVLVKEAEGADLILA